MTTRASHSACSTPTPPRRGYTLIEMLVVFAVIGVIAAFALPRFRMERFQVDSAARSLNMALMSARTDAAARGHNVLIVFDTAKGLVRTVWDANNNERVDVGEHTRPTLMPEGVRFGRGTSVPAFGTDAGQFPTLQQVNSQPMLVMQRNGALDRAAVFYLGARRKRSSDSFGDTRMVRVDRATGRGRVFIYLSSGWKAQ
ncbi:MAG: prepilin-type N-terminal cleavage/methylation domain-containing protein [Gemmatimonadaceae bacterium]|nr:prepilin-type N-terminal cleavage/methylation domain-containing protein [Gemmatimonadaceae bacterium]